MKFGLLETQGVDMLLFLVQASHIRHQDIIDSLRRFGSEVMPQFERPQRAAAS